MSDLIETFAGGGVTQSVHFKTKIILASSLAYVTVWVERTVGQTAEPHALSPFAHQPDAEARITRVGNHMLGQRIGDTRWHIFDTCPTWWQGFPDGSHEIEVTLRTRNALATATVHLRLHSLAPVETTASSRSHAHQS